MAAAVCQCLSSVQPPQLRLRPPPDPSLVWHLLSDEPFVKAPDCAWSPLLGPNGAPSSLALTSPTLILSLAALLILVLALAVVCAFCILAKRRRVHKGSEAVSTEAIVTSGDHLWSYNSMKSHHATHHNPLVGSMYGSSGMMHGVATPASLRHYNNNVQHVQQGVPPMMRHAQSAHFVRQGTLRIVPGDHPGAVAVDASSFHTLGRHYEEIGDPSAHYSYGSGANVAYPLHPSGAVHHGGGLPYVVNCGPGGGGISYTLGTAANQGKIFGRENLTPPSRHSVRRPPPACRPPPPPQESEQCSPRSEVSSSSTSSYDHELSTVMGGRVPVGGAPEDPLPRREYLGPTTLAAGAGPPSSNEGDSSPPLMGRESGYGTAPSRQWRTPPGSAGKGSGDDTSSPPLHPAPSIQQSMTYV
ncbi:hypothetical protein PMAYCL1PPCAC_28640 [Pristionchus mayeri]|uniref:Uncharacterized protein n=1 Tax=Pristionchus mayeri TaxID=1317129 RepID=A0AAN5D9A6_9BILA|nr:hypothetical protein PMAYCL1PPCAC_28640 [Pristionchus mayeri]